MFKYRSENSSSKILRILNEGAMKNLFMGVEEIKKLANADHGKYTCKLQDLDTMKQIAKEYDIKVEENGDGTVVTFYVPGSKPFSVSALDTMEEGEAPAKSYVPGGPVKEEDDPIEIAPEELNEPTPEEVEEVNREANTKKIYVVKESCKK